LDFNGFRLILKGLALGFQWISIDFEGLGPWISMDFGLFCKAWPFGFQWISVVFEGLVGP
jgi:hypothetical protein